MIKKNFPHVAISTDMAKVGVAKAALEAGAEMFCDVIPIRYNLEFIQFIAKHNLPMLLMYAPGISRMPQPLGVVSDILRDIQANTNFAVSNGISKEKIIIDPSICFGRKDKDNFLMMRQLSNFRHLKMPISVMFSRKSFLNSSLVGSMRKQQINSVITNTLAVLNNCNIVRLESVEQISLLRNILDIIHPSVEA
jgi:dihydropteroate synthase